MEIVRNGDDYTIDIAEDFCVLRRGALNTESLCELAHTTGVAVDQDEVRDNLRMTKQRRHVI